MLDTIKQCINELPDRSFVDFYHDFVLQSQHSIINHDIKLASRDYSSLTDISQLMKGLNSLTEELKLT